MTYLEAIELIKGRIDEVDADEQIIDIIEKAFNKAYIEIRTKLLPTVLDAIIEVVDGVGDLPNDCHRIEYMSRGLANGERIIGNKIFTNGTTEDIRICYITTVLPIVLEFDEETNLPIDTEIDLPYSLIYSCTTYACYAYYTHRKKDALSRAYFNEYEMDKINYFDNGLDETVRDDGVYYG